MNILIVTHVVPDILDFVESIKTITDKIKIIPKPNSIDKEVLDAIEANCKVIRVSRKELGSKGKLEKMLPKNENNLNRDWKKFEDLFRAS